MHMYSISTKLICFERPLGQVIFRGGTWMLVIDCSVVKGTKSHVSSLHDSHMTSLGHCSSLLWSVLFSWWPYAPCRMYRKPGLGQWISRDCPWRTVIQSSPTRATSASSLKATYSNRRKHRRQNLAIICYHEQIWGGEGWGGKGCGLVWCVGDEGVDVGVVWVGRGVGMCGCGGGCDDGAGVGVGVGECYVLWAFGEISHPGCHSILRHHFVGIWIPMLNPRCSSDLIF